MLSIHCAHIVLTSAVIGQQMSSCFTLAVLTSIYHAMQLVSPPVAFSIKGWGKVLSLKQVCSTGRMGSFWCIWKESPPLVSGLCNSVFIMAQRMVKLYAPWLLICKLLHIVLHTFDKGAKKTDKSYPKDRFPSPSISFVRSLNPGVPLRYKIIQARCSDKLRASFHFISGRRKELLH